MRLLAHEGSQLALRAYRKTRRIQSAKLSECTPRHSLSCGLTPPRSRKCTRSCMEGTWPSDSRRTTEPVQTLRPQALTVPRIATPVCPVQCAQELLLTAPAPRQSALAAGASHQRWGPVAGRRPSVRQFVTKGSAGPLPLGQTPVARCERGPVDFDFAESCSVPTPDTHAATAQ